MRIGILTSSRADFGIYSPLLRALKDDHVFTTTIIAFGTHLSRFHGYTIEQIRREGYEVSFEIENMLTGDSDEAISTAMGLTQLKFAAFWAAVRDRFDVVFCLGDRYEMYAAVSAAVPYNLKFAHIHGGETTLGAIDNQFRHCLSLFSSLHFTATETYAERVREITGSSLVYNVGALGLDNIASQPLYTPTEFFNVFDIDLRIPSILVTYHPETLNPQQSVANAQILAEALKQLPYQVVITMPNADTMGASMREIYLRLAEVAPHVRCVENFGTRGYFTCLKYCKFLLGNSSSGIIEAASFGKYVINLGRRQDGRIASGNVAQLTDFNVTTLVDCCTDVAGKGEYTGDNVYYRGGAASQILTVLKDKNVKGL